MRGKSIVRRTPSHEAGGAGVGREHLGDEDLRRISRQLDKEDHSEPDRQHHRLAPRIGPEQPEQGGEKKGGDSFVRITRWPGRGGAEKAQRSIE